MQCNHRIGNRRCIIELPHTAGNHYMTADKPFRQRYPVFHALIITYVGILAVMAGTIGVLVAVTV